ncbi:MAG: thioredoxin family protein [Planctomycetota bacterium]|nr:MAG: thioredoxin family protein [Planctomycetota bacterium]
MRYLLLLPLLCLAALAHAAVAPGDKAPTFTLPTATGETINLADHKDKVIILEWVNFDCPFVRKHYVAQGDQPGNMPALQAMAKEHGMVWLSICSSAPGTQGHFVGEALIERIAKEKSAATAYLIDEDGSVGRAYGARVTPHMFIIKDGKIVYAGGIDSIRSTRASDIPNATQYVRDVMVAIANGEEIPHSETDAYGCTVKYAD